MRGAPLVVGAGPMHTGVQRGRNPGRGCKITRPLVSAVQGWWMPEGLGPYNSMGDLG